MNECNVNIICRVCLRDDVNLGKCLSLFQWYKDSLLFEKLNSIINFKIEEGDGFPDKICPDCLLEFENALQFKEKCERSNQVLQNTKPIKIEKYQFFLKINANVNDSQNADKIEDIKEEPAENSDREDLKQELGENVYDDGLFKTVDISDSIDESNALPIRKSRAINLHLICNDCGGSFKSKCKLAVHWRKEHLAKQLLCERCKRQFKSFKAYISHKKRGTIGCKEALNIDIKGEGRNREFNCKVCEYKSFRIKDMVSHLVTHTGERPFKCNICGRFFTQLSSLTSHKERAHKLFKWKGACDYCGKFIEGRAKLYKHILTHNEQKVQCDQCNKLFKTNQSLKVHKLRHSGYKQYTCEICAASFFTVPDLCNHKRSQHTNIGILKCDLCGYVSKTLSGHSRHKNKHTDTNFCCSICGTFVSNDETENHKKWHSSKTISCSYCEKTYNHKRSLYKHIQRVHKPILDNKPAIPKKSVNVKKENSTYIIINPSVNIMLPSVQ